MRAYRMLCGVLGIAFVLFGVALVLGFFRALMPGAVATGPLPAGPGTDYFMAFTGCALVGWGGGLLGAVRQPEASRTIGTATAVALVLMALYRIWAWLMGDYASLGNLLRVEAAVFLLLALAFVWLRPAKARRLRPEAPIPASTAG